MWKANDKPIQNLTFHSEQLCILGFQCIGWLAFLVSYWSALTFFITNAESDNI
jgi:hypothetical protein